MKEKEIKWDNEIRFYLELTYYKKLTSGVTMNYYPLSTSAEENSVIVDLTDDQEIEMTEGADFWLKELFADEINYVEAIRENSCRIGEFELPYEIQPKSLEKNSKEFLAEQVVHGLRDYVVGVYKGVEDGTNYEEEIELTLNWSSSDESYSVKIKTIK